MPTKRKIYASFCWLRAKLDNPQCGGFEKDSCRQKKEPLFSFTIGAQLEQCLSGERIGEFHKEGAGGDVKPVRSSLGCPADLPLRLEQGELLRS